MIKYICDNCFKEVPQGCLNHIELNLSEDPQGQIRHIKNIRIDVCKDCEKETIAKCEAVLEAIENKLKKTSDSEVSHALDERNSKEWVKNGLNIA